MSPDFDVAIIGMGPAGACLANWLGAYGLSVLVIERDTEIYPLPRAVHFDGEVMRVFETLGLREQIEAISRPGQVGMHFNNADGETLLIRAGSSANGPHGCANNHYFHQPELEAVLRDALRRYPHVQVRLGHEVQDVVDGANSATLHLLELASGRRLETQARYVVGCDGARSLVRKIIDSPMLDLGLHQPWLVFDVRLKAPLPGLPEYTVQHCDPARPMTYCNVTGNRRRWEIMLMPGDDPEALVQPKTLWSLVSRWVHPEDAELERAAIYTFHSVIAQTWRRGHLFLAGDAAHQTPPFLGQGMCAGIRDAANLAWKLHAVLRGQASDALLDSYGTERLPHVQAFIELAVKLGDIIQTTDPQAAQERDARFRCGQPEIFHFPTPRLGPGCWHNPENSSGQVFPQPVLADGRLMDSALGLGFGLLVTRSLWDQVDEAACRAWNQSGVTVLDDRHPALADVLRAQGVQAVLVRPDRYVAGVANDPAQLQGLWPLLSQALSPVH
ncbi:MAG: bifunctional 3-(3-hydroxy-phenyl)propionate/3-hydroxycinnamic acid hydroxylase [Alphaproteobacteria bacterium]|nr:bifunctional 3-(3-hydroxy-phenyl)propionate/3-hydroxycinnamic acid hydroxylase [Alphaproteobacteria bacterium]